MTRLATSLRALKTQALTALLAGLLAACASAPPVTSPGTPPATDNRSNRPAPAPATKPVEPRPAPSPMPPATTKKGGGYYKDDGPGDNPPPDMASIPDAEPRVEPLHRFANRPYAALGQSYVPLLEIAPYTETGIASWYGRRFHGVRTSSGERYDMYGMTAAHPTLPIPSYARVTNVENGKSVVVRINDRGPFHSNRVIDLSYTAAWKLGYVSKGSTRVQVESIVPEGVALLGRSVPPLATATASASTAAPVAPAQQIANAETAAPAIMPPEAPVRSEAPVTTATATPAAPVLVAAIPSVSDSPAALATGIYLQLGAFSTNGNAESFREYARQELGNVKQQLLIVADTDKGRERFRLHLGPFASADSAREMADRVAGKLKLKPFVVQR